MQRFASHRIKQRSSCSPALVIGQQGEADQDHGLPVCLDGVGRQTHHLAPLAGQKSRAGQQVILPAEAVHHGFVPEVL